MENLIKVNIEEEKFVNKEFFIDAYNLDHNFTFRVVKENFNEFDLINAWGEKMFERSEEIKLQSGDYKIKLTDLKIEEFYVKIHKKLKEIFRDPHYLEIKSAIENTVLILKKLNVEKKDWLINLTMAICYFHNERFEESNYEFDKALEFDDLPLSFREEINNLKTENIRRKDLVSSMKIYRTSPKKYIFIACEGDISTPEYSWQFKLLKSIYESDDLGHKDINVNKHKVFYVQTPYISNMQQVLSLIKNRKSDGIIWFMHSSMDDFKVWLNDKEEILNIDGNSEMLFSHYRQILDISETNFLLILGCDSENLVKVSPLEKTIGSNMKNHLSNLYPFVFSFFKSQMYQSEWTESFNLAKSYARFFSTNATGFIKK